jgi:uncharacterized protein (DUF362 family)
MTDVAVVKISRDLKAAVRETLEKTAGSDNLIKSSGDVYLKPNGIDFKPYAFTDPQILEATIGYFTEEGASRVFVMENSTQANMTRIVFEFNGYKEVCKRTGAKPIFLDEGKFEPVKFEHFDDPVEIPSLIVEKFIEGKDENSYISLPKLKTHSMSTVTLGVKNQMAFPKHSNRGYHHNYELHRYLADIFLLVQPDYTLIDGTHAVFNGHYPLETFLSESVEELGILIGGADTLMTDMVGARVLGYRMDEVKHLNLVAEDRRFTKSLSDIAVEGDLSGFTKRYPCDIMDKMPEDVTILRGTEMLCREGCDLNVRMLLQILYYDFNGKGGFTILMGKGFDREELERIEGRVLIAGDCAIEETRELLENQLGKKNVFTSPTCNRLAATTGALCKLMGVSTLDLVPSKSTAVKALLQAKMKGSTALTPPLF